MSSSSGHGAADTGNLCLLPFPREISMRGAPFRPTPSSYLYVSPQASPSTRRKCHLIAESMQELGFRTTLSTAPALGPTQAYYTPAASFVKPEGLERPLRGASSGNDAYRLSVHSEGVLLHGADEQGLQYAGFTLRQLVEDGPQVPGMEIDDHPLLPYRVMHLDFKGWAPKPAYLKQLIKMLAHIKINAILLEYEAYYDFPSQPGVAGKGALTPDDVAEIELLAQDYGVTLIPLIHSIGNLGHLLRLPTYAELREHPNYYQMLCPVNPASLDIVTAMFEDMIAAHQCKYIHVGGDEVRLLGYNKNSDARAKQLGGRAALYLEYMAKVCRYLLSRQRHPLIWDDMFRKMSDDQVKWLPPEAVLTFWEYEGQDGRATPAILTNLDRYRKLGRRVWGAATRTPATRYDAFDNIDAWTEAAQLGYIDGLITTGWTRDHTLGALFAPHETVWPATFYAAERCWSGLKDLPRERFPHRFAARMFGTKDGHMQGRVWAGFDLLLRDYPRRAREFFMGSLKHVSRNQETLMFMDVWTAMGGFREYLKQFQDEVASNYANLQAGKADPLASGRLRFRIQDLKNKLPALMANFRRHAGRITHEHIIEEYLESVVAFGLQRLDEYESLLSSYPMADGALQQPVSL